MKGAQSSAIMLAVVLSACATPPVTPSKTPPDTSREITVGQIIADAHAAAGGPSWTRPQSLTMRGHATFYDGADARHHESHEMWRIYDATKTDAHTADGKVRIRSVREGIPIIDVAFDGANTSTRDGPRAQSAADRQWAGNFGFGVIRHALDPGYTLARLPDAPVDGDPAYTVKVTDPAGGDTLFSIRHADSAITRVGFVTDRGWHERHYSDFFSKPGTDWQQPGHVRLLYDSVVANEVTWTDFTLNDAIPDCLFRLPESEGCR